MISFSSFSAGILPCPTATRALGHTRVISPWMDIRSSTRLWTKYTWPPRASSASTASRMISSEKTCDSVTIGWRLGGGVEMTDRSREPMSENCSVRGIGVAVRVSVSTLTAICVSFSLAATPNFCSSSMISSPRSRNLICLPSILWVPIRMSIRPDSRSARICPASLAVLVRLRYSTRTGKSRRRSEKER